MRRELLHRNNNLCLPVTVMRPLALYLFSMHANSMRKEAGVTTWAMAMANGGSVNTVMKEIVTPYIV